MPSNSETDSSTDGSSADSSSQNPFHEQLLEVITQVDDDGERLKDHTLRVLIREEIDPEAASKLQTRLRTFIISEIDATDDVKTAEVSLALWAELLYIAGLFGSDGSESTDGNSDESDDEVATASDPESSPESDRGNDTASSSSSDSLADLPQRSDAYDSDEDDDSEVDDDPMYQ